MGRREKKKKKERRERRGRRGLCDGMGLNAAMHELSNSIRVMGWLDQPPRVH